MAGIAHAQFPFDESPWIMHFHDADDGNQRSQIHFAAQADQRGNDLFAQHIMSAQPGTNPFAGYAGPFGEGRKGQQFTPDMPDHLLSQYFGSYLKPGALPGSAGPYADPRINAPDGAAGPAVTGDDYLRQLYNRPGRATAGPQPGGAY